MIESEPPTSPYVPHPLEDGRERSTDLPSKKTPPTWALVCLNAGLILAACLIGSRWPIGTIMAVASAGFLIAGSGVWQLIARLIERRFRLNPPLRVVVYLFPFIALVGLPLLGFRPPQPANKRYPAESPSGKYTARVNAPGEYWRVAITGKDGSKFDEQTDFIGHFNVYWCWDSSERLWIYNSDDGMIHYWQLEGSTWKHVDSTGALKPPDALLPVSARK